MLVHNAAHEPEREGDAAATPDLALVRFFQPRHHVDQGRLAGAVRCENAKRAAKLHPEGDFFQNHLALRACPEGLADILEFEHHLLRFCSSARL